MVVNRGRCCVANSLKSVIVFLLLWGIILGIYELSSIKSNHIKVKDVCITCRSMSSSVKLNELPKLRMASSNRPLLPTNRNEFINRRTSKKSKLSKTTLHTDAHNSLNSVFRKQINATAVSLMRQKLITNGFSPRDSVHIYKITYRRGKGVAGVSFPEHSKHWTRPDGSPWLSEAETCAVVGNSGILKGSKCGNEIDSHDLVFRTNMSPIDGFVKDAGRRTTLNTVNRVAADKIFKCLIVKQRQCRTPALDYASSHLTDAIIWMPKMNTRANQYYRRAISEFQKYFRGFVFGYPNKNLELPIRKLWNLTDVPTSGLYLYAIAGTVCKKISLYGFYPFTHTESGRALTYHYFDEETIVDRIIPHNMTREYLELLKLNEAGVVRLVTDNCKQ
ncbi:CMP-N-acetylneuraminate-poly-alpha-2,8-sialyltransferase-like isoform X2 [Antedon mediterranea]|uniref:CMP-N-acetylneuraminate-poly-alpha-2, 8-sialyltransferase-like isoform X2 n=1 Tax=Antedon mediterranea TaxID=105859 RepID=UPI003AF7954C